MCVTCVRWGGGGIWSLFVYLAELSMLLNQARTEGSSEGVEKARSSGGGFTGLVRHVMELSVVGEVPLAIDAGTLGEDVIDEPLGCTIEYTLPSGCEVIPMSCAELQSSRSFLCVFLFLSYFYFFSSMGSSRALIAVRS